MMTLLEEEEQAVEDRQLEVEEVRRVPCWQGQAGRRRM